MMSWRLVMGALVIAFAMTGCGDDGTSVPDAGSGVDDGGGGTDAGGGGDTDAGGGGDTDAGGGGDTDAGGSGDTDAGGGDSDAGGGGGPTFVQLRAGLVSCMGCHQGAGPAGFSLSGTDAQVYAELVDEQRTDDGCPTSSRRVVPNQTGMSVLYLRTHGNTCGSMMPANATQRQLIEDWILAGAPGPL